MKDFCTWIIDPVIYLHLFLIKYDQKHKSRMKNELNRTDKERYHEKDIKLPSSRRVSIVFAISSFILVSVASYTIGNSIRLYQFSQKSLKKKPQQISSETSQSKHDIGSTCRPTDAEHMLIDVINIRDKELLVDHNSFLRNLVTSPILEFTSCELSWLPCRQSACQ